MLRNNLQLYVVVEMSFLKKPSAFSCEGALLSTDEIRHEYQGLIWYY